MDKDGLVTESEPLLSFVFPEDGKRIGGLAADAGVFLQLGHVKGLGRVTTFLLPLACVWWQSSRQPGLRLIDFFPKLVGTASTVHFVLEQFTTYTDIALRNAQLSHRGSLRKAHCVVTWVSSLDPLLIFSVGFVLAQYELSGKA